MSLAAIELVKSVYAAFGKRDLEAISRLVAPDIQIEQSTELPWGGKYQGADGLGEFFARLTQHVDSKLVFERFLDAGDHVVLIGRTQGTTVAGGKPFDVPIAHVWTVQNGRITAFRPHIDNPTMLAALSQKS